MSKSARISTVRKHRLQQQHSAARRLGTANSALQQAATTLDHLEGHRRGYQAELLERARRGMSAAALRRQLLFLRTLGDAVDSQEQAVRTSETDVDQCRDSWRDRYRASQSLTRLEDRLRDGENREAERRESREQDDTWQARAALTA